MADENDEKNKNFRGIATIQTCMISVVYDMEILFVYHFETGE